MTLADIITKLKAVALTEPTVNTVIDNDVFRLNAMKSAKYGVFAYTQGQHSGSLSNTHPTYNFTLFYVDRLCEGEANEVDIQSVGVATIQDVLRKMEDYCEVGQWTATTFRQRFVDQCAGVFVNVAFTVAVDYNCSDTFAI